MSEVERLVTISLLLASGICVTRAADEAAGSASANYTLDRVLQAIRSREPRDRDVALRIEYSHRVNNVQNQPPQETECTLVSHSDNYRNEVRDAQGRKGWEYHVNGSWVEIGRRWEGVDMLLPINGAEGKELGGRIYYHAFNVGFNSDSVARQFRKRIEPWRIDYYREAEKAGNLKIKTGDVGGVSCVELSVGGAVLCLAPEHECSVVRCDDLTASGFHRFDGRWFPTVLRRTRNLHDLRGGFCTYRETFEIQKVSEIEAPDADFWKLPDPTPGTWVKVAYPRWNNKWEDEFGPGVTRQTVLDRVRAEHSFAWPPSGKDARIYETSRHWRGRAKLDEALSGGSNRALLPFLSWDAEQVIWATYDPATKRLVPSENDAPAR